MPKLMLKPLGYSNGTLCDLEQAKNLNYNGAMVLIDGKRIHSYDELIQLATQDTYKNREFIDVVLLSTVEGG